jgi:hypothetical protein
METTNWASENLQVIRTLMERTALYRRTLAPVMMVNGLIGLVAAAVAYGINLAGNRAFSALWMGVSLLALIASFLLVRRQALKEAEPFWSPPTRRISQALLPPFVAGLAAGGIYLIAPNLLPPPWVLASIWMILYGLSLHAAGFFMQRGIKLLGWCFVLGGIALPYAVYFGLELEHSRIFGSGHAIMGGFFGLLQLAYSVYLYFTEKSKGTA